MTVDSTEVDTSKAGTYEVTYTYDGITSVAKVTVKARQTALKVHDSSIYVGDAWKAEDNFDSAVDKDGKPVAFKDITVDSTEVDTSKAGTYEVTYTYDGVTSVAKVTVKARQTAVKVHDSSIYVGDAWKAEDNFDSATNKDGEPVAFKDLTVDDTKVDTSKAGTYEVTYMYDGVTSVAKVTVKAIKTAVKVHDSSIYVGDAWKAEDNFDSAVDKDGNPVDFKDITVDSTKVETSKTGTYEVTYTYDGVTSVAKVTVKERKASKGTVTVKYIDEDGNKLSEDVVLSGIEGEEYETKAKHISGYELIHEPANKKGKFKKNIVVEYIYTNKKGSATVVNNNQAKGTGSVSSNTGILHEKNNIKKSGQLPKTNEQVSVVAPFIGILVILSVAYFYFRKGKLNK
ncbi:bacterial Ig-like domain-containing protein [Enterococcus raffinosus]|uniref:Bacterial Ig-like domain-containing protein n=1 Tax=Enterococcus raffinosus TaxID=71452 RepID=A0AAW8T6X5_9ENTE|nr:bacterial Ig-like domain-containing protein [Enterococcus raffinosus]MDT2523748.1 bacterial Ig-like domain-containing protein [Enterococcus raffinosus]MDT2529717.1 bacterial Ig-like domain-containing protein [Enterococcus raffinosus]MDT2534271.1 bacterial Ig-like domain-containing protein [Enterococcus raffinosus]MDT2544885.1 bacterial Ig-like domain-containing protein [Enterococcus raffinosus]MDT2556831.1 bacterial Ig-like domain-containing protein [Enterococcus raffinosus]